MSWLSSAIKINSVFIFDDFEKLMFESKDDTLFKSFETKIVELNIEGRAGYASSYLCALNSIKQFQGGQRVRNGRSVTIEGGKDIPLKNVTVAFLKGYEQWFLKQTRVDGTPFSSTSVGIYLRNVRVLLNDAISNKILSPDVKPFDKRGYRLPNNKKRKLALRLEDIGKIMNAKVVAGSPHEKYRDYWLFLYLTGGMNVADKATLQYGDIDEEKISYVRRKTALKKMEAPDTITVPLTTEVNGFIDKWGQKPALSDTHIFPILKPKMTPQEERAAIVQATKTINKYIKIIATEATIEGNISTYTARHSFATVLKNSGVSVQAISEALGHSSTKVTQAYLKDFEVEEKRKQFSNLIPIATNDESQIEGSEVLGLS
jgi:integrase